jgi:hypothetical protein
MATITTRAGKGSPLTNTEVDANFTNLNADKIEDTDLSVSTGSASGGGSLSYSAGVFTFAPTDLNLTDGYVFIGNIGGTYDKRALVVADVSDVTANATELNYVQGVTSAIQTQLTYSDDRSINALGSVSGTTDIDLADGTNVTATIAGATTFTISGITSGSVNTVTLYLTNAGAYTITWPSGTTFNRNAAPVLPASGDTIIVLETYDNATSFAGIQVWRSV